MKFAINGVDFQNKGGELMMHAVKQQVQEWDSQNTLSAHLKVGSYAQRQAIGVKHLTYRSSRQMPFTADLVSALTGLIPQPIRDRYSLTLESEVDVIFDASGFAFSDQWGPEDTERMASLCQRWKKQGKRSILLPQAFGPFTGDRIQKAFIQIVENVDLIFARDQVSYDLVRQLPISMDKIKIAPDFTNLVKGVEPDYIDDLRGRPCITPNYRMIDKAAATSSGYLDFLSAMIDHLLAKGLEPFILIHETKDVDLGKLLQEKASRKIQVIVEDSPLCLKGILGTSQLLIGSRFHGLVSALSQGIPCLGAGWSHKYQMLFDSYDCSNLLVDPNGNLTETLATLDAVLNEPTRSQMMEKIVQASATQKQLSRQMWADVKAMLNPHATVSTYAGNPGDRVVLNKIAAQ
jgi:polysaccharide pyruvyl transferase WcaK-like protein